jgi:hypothetical protein
MRLSSSAAIGGNRYHEQVVEIDCAGHSDLHSRRDANERRRPVSTDAFLLHVISLYSSSAQDVQYHRPGDAPLAHTIDGNFGKTDQVRIRHPFSHGFLEGSRCHARFELVQGKRHTWHGGLDDSGKCGGL